MLWQALVTVKVGDYTFQFSGHETSVNDRLRLWTAVTIIRARRRTLSFDAPCFVTLRQKEAKRMQLRQGNLILFAVGVDAKAAAESEDCVCALILCPSNSQPVIPRRFQLRVPLLWLTRAAPLDRKQWTEQELVGAMSEACKAVKRGDLLTPDDVLGAINAELQRVDSDADCGDAETTETAEKPRRGRRKREDSPSSPRPTRVGSRQPRKRHSNVRFRVLSSSCVAETDSTRRGGGTGTKPPVGAEHKHRQGGTAQPTGELHSPGNSWGSVMAADAEMTETEIGEDIAADTGDVEEQPDEAVPAALTDRDSPEDASGSQNDIMTDGSSDSKLVSRLVRELGQRLPHADLKAVRRRHKLNLKQKYVSLALALLYLD
jgi:hypothetical protein